MLSRYWIKSEEGGDGKRTLLPPTFIQQERLHPLLGRRLDSPRHIFESHLSTDSMPELKKNRIDGTPILPTTAILEMVFAAADEVFGAEEPSLEGLDFHEPMVLQNQ